MSATSRRGHANLLVLAFLFLATAGLPGCGEEPASEPSAVETEAAPAQGESPTPLSEEDFEDGETGDLHAETGDS